MWSFLSKNNQHQVIENKNSAHILLDEKSFAEHKEEKKGCLTRIKKSLYKAFSIHNALSMGICGFSAVTTIMDNAFLQSDANGASDVSQSTQFYLTVCFGTFGFLTLTLLTYKGIQRSNLNDEKKQLDKLITDAEETARQSNDLVNKTISQRSKIKKILTETEKREKHFNSSFEFLLAPQSIRIPAKLTIQKKKKGKDFKCSCKSAGNILLHGLAGTVTLTTHLLAIQSMIDNLNKYNIDIGFTETQIWAICGALVGIFDMYGIFNIYKLINSSGELKIILDEKKDTFYQASNFFLETKKNINSIDIDHEIQVLANQSKMIDKLLERKIVQPSSVSRCIAKLKPQSCICSSDHCKLTKGKVKADLKYISIRIFQFLNALTAMGSVGSAHFNVYFFIKEHSRTFPQKAWMLGLGINGGIACYQAFKYGWHGIETGLYRYRPHKSPQQLLAIEITLTTNETKRATNKNEKNIKDIHKLKGMLERQLLLLNNNNQQVENPLECKITIIHSLRSPTVESSPSTEVTLLSLQEEKSSVDTSPQPQITSDALSPNSLFSPSRSSASPVVIKDEKHTIEPSKSKESAGTLNRFFPPSEESARPLVPVPTKSTSQIVIIK